MRILFISLGHATPGLSRRGEKTETDLGVTEVLLAVRLAVFLLHEGNPAQLAFLDEWLDVHGADSVATDAFVVLEHKAVL